MRYDDGDYVFDNPNVRAGLTLPGVAWAFTTNETANWHPLTWLSHMADVQLWALNPVGHHFTGVLLHVLNAILLYLLLEKMTGASWRAAAAAALFALHPLRVESVAWVAERKDVLSTLLGLLCLLAYVRYVRQGGKASFAWSLLLFAASLMAKPMLVTLPFLLLVLDYWPLERMGDAVSAGEHSSRPGARRLILEKAPFLLLAVASSAVTLWAQRRAMSALPLPLAVRIDNAVLSYARYLGKLIYPVHLAVLYPHPGVVQGVKTLAAGALLLAATASFVLLRRRIPYLLAGWLWYGGTLVPVIGLVQVGWQSMADRYTYFPSIGLVVMAVWGLSDLAARWPARRALLAGSTALVLCALSILTILQIRHWKDAVSLFEHALQTTDRNAIVNYFLGNELLSQGRVAEGTLHLEEALRLNPDFPEAHYQLGALAGGRGQWAEAASHARAALKLRPEFAEGHCQLGVALDSQGQTSEAIHHYGAALRLKPDYAEAHKYLGKALLRQQRISEAVTHLERWLELEPTPQGHSDLALALDLLAAEQARLGDFEQAVATEHKAIGLARASGAAEAMQRLQARLDSYKARRP